MLGTDRKSCLKLGMGLISLWHFVRIGFFFEPSERTMAKHIIDEAVVREITVMVAARAAAKQAQVCPY
jgi:hypothetical protein